jgi:hypothetical protein
MAVTPLPERRSWQALKRHAAEPALGRDSSTNALIRRYRALKAR